MQLGHEWEQHLFILIFLLQPELAFSPGVVEWVDDLLPLSLLDTGAVAGECEPLGTWTRSRGVQGCPPGRQAKVRHTDTGTRLSLFKSYNCCLLAL